MYMCILRLLNARLTTKQYGIAAHQPIKLDCTPSIRSVFTLHHILTNLSCIVSCHVTFCLTDWCSLKANHWFQRIRSVCVCMCVLNCWTECACMCFYGLSLQVVARMFMSLSCPPMLWPWVFILACTSPTHFYSPCYTHTHTQTLKPRSLLASPSSVWTNDQK